MNITLLIMLLLTVAMTVIAYKKSPKLPLEGLMTGGELFWDILPAMALGFILAGMISILLPKEIMSKWLGEESGLRGLLLGTMAGMLTPGGPFIQFPIVAALLKAGAGIAPLVAYISAWSLTSLNRFFVWEVPLLGPKLAGCRMAVSLIFPILLGLLTRFLWGRVQ
jgi:uncharacterized membrane protein YraQ (UPF0718 family)